MEWRNLEIQELPNERIGNSKIRESKFAVRYALCAMRRIYMRLGFKDTELLHSVTEGITADV